MVDNGPFRYLTACLVALCGVGLAAQDDRPRVPVSRWIERLGPPDTTAAAEFALERAGQSAVLALIACLEQTGADVLAQRRAAAALAVLGRMGPDAVEAYDAIMGLAHNTGLFVEALRARADLAPYVGSDGPQISLLTKHMNNKSMGPAVGRATVQLQRLLARGKVSADAGLDELIAFVKGNDVFTRAAAAEIIGRRGAGAAAAFDVPHNVLAQRGTSPDGWDSFLHNGFVEPLMNL